MSGGRVWGKECATVLFSRAVRSMQVLRAGSVVPFIPVLRNLPAGIKKETPRAMGRDMRAGVQTARNRTVGVCEPGHGERGSGKYELKPWVTRYAQTNSPGSRGGVGKTRCETVWS
jgi:hypothetical protein